MNYDNKKVAGLLFFVGAAQFVLAVVVSEAIYPGYNVGQQIMSDLGDWSLAGNAAAIFDVSIVLLGILTVAGAYFIQRGFQNRLFPSLLVITGILAVIVGVIAENVFLSVHTIVAGFFFWFAAASTIMSYKFEKPPLSYLFVILGAIILLAIVLFSLGNSVNSIFFLDLGIGGMQRFIVYPFLLWLLGLGAYLIGDSSGTTTTGKV